MAFVNIMLSRGKEPRHHIRRLQEVLLEVTKASELQREGSKIFQSRKRQSLQIPGSFSSLFL